MKNIIHITKPYIYLCKTDYIDSIDGYRPQPSFLQYGNLLSELIWSIYSHEDLYHISTGLKKVKTKSTDDPESIPWYYIMLNNRKEDCIQELIPADHDWAMAPYRWWDGETIWAISYSDYTYILL